MTVSTQQILNGVIDMQANAQQALPVIPNNGNPAGVYNMPIRAVSQPATPVAQPQTAVPHMARPLPPEVRYPWLQPSQSARNVRDMLQSRRGAGFSRADAAQEQQLPQNPSMRPVLPIRR